MSNKQHARRKRIGDLKPHQTAQLREKLNGPGVIWVDDQGNLNLRFLTPQEARAYKQEFAHRSQAQKGIILSNKRHPHAKGILTTEDRPFQLPFALTSSEAIAREEHAIQIERALYQKHLSKLEGRTQPGPSFTP